MPTQGQRQGWKWLVGLGLVTVYGLIASPASFATTRMACGEDYVIDCEERRKEHSDCHEGKSRSDCDERRTDGGISCKVRDSECRISETPKVTVTLTVERMLIDCKLDVSPENLSTTKELKVVVGNCLFVHEEEKDGRQVVTRFAVKVEDVDLTSLRLHPCLIWPDCVEDLAQFNAFQGNGLRQNQKESELRFVDCDKEFSEFFGKQCQELVLIYDDLALLQRACSTCERSTLGVIGQFKKSAQAISQTGERLPVGQAFIRGMDVVTCSPSP